MKTCHLTRCLLLLLFAVVWDTADCLCSLDKYTAALCHDLEDARYINTYHLEALRARSSSKLLAPGNFENLTSLRHLDLSNGNIVLIKSGSFARLAALQTLNLANNRISHLEAGAFDGLKHLYSLRLEGNAVRQLPAALMSLNELKFLDLSDNLINCNCASMKLRDALVARGVKIGRRTYCTEPASVKHASIFKPDTRAICEFEKQDNEMQRDQPLENEDKDEDGLLETDTDKDLAYDEKEDEEALSTETGEETTTPSPSMVTSHSEANLPLSSNDTSTEAVPGLTSITRDDITFEDTEDSLRKETTTDSAVDEPATKSTSESSVSSTAATDAVVPDEGSGESDDDGSGSEGSGIIARMPAIDFNETSGGAEDEEGEEGLPESSSSSSVSSSTSSTTESSGWWGFIKNLNPWSSSDTSEAPSTTEKSTEDDLKEEQFIQVTSHEEESTRRATVTSAEVAHPEVVPNIVPTNEDLSKQAPKIEDFGNNDLEDNSVDTSPSQDGKKGIGSYVVLVTLLAILVILLGLAVYKGDFCRRKRKRRDVERGTEMKDMQKTLLDHSGSQPKVQPINGNTMENVPLMNSTNLPDEPKDNQKSYNVSNGANKSNGVAIEVNDPVKPSRKSLKQEIEAPLNGLNPPMEPIDASIRTSLYSESNEIIDALDYCERPPLTPGAHRVKITMQENPDSVPKTPVLITRMKDDENLVKAP